MPAKLTPTQAGEAIEHLAELVDGVRSDLADLLRREATDTADGYPTRSGFERSSAGTVLDDVGDPMPPRSDPVGELVVADDRPDPIREALRGLVDRIAAARRLLEAARSQAAQARPPGPGPGEHPEGCRNHARHRAGWEPVYRSNECSWCYRFRRTEGVDAPKVLLEARARGERITQQAVDRALGRRKLAGARR